MTVVSLAEAKAAREPHWAGLCVCLRCRHEWAGVGPLGHHEGLWCPVCDLPKGVTKHLFGAPEGAAQFACRCGCEAMTIYHDDQLHVRCMACGSDQTGAVLCEA